MEKKLQDESTLISNVSKGILEREFLAESSSSYWQKRLDLLHRSVQSVVNNGTALAAASLRRLNLDNNNSLISKNAIEPLENFTKVAQLLSPNNNKSLLNINSNTPNILDSLSPNFIKALRKSPQQQDVQVIFFCLIRTS